MRLGDLDALAENLTLLAKYEDAFSANVILGIVSTVRNTKTIDAVQVCRCKDCKHTREKTSYEAAYLIPECLICEHPEVSEDGWAAVIPEHFCSYGERKDGDG